MLDSVTWKIGGEAGFGIMSAGTMLARAFARRGYHTLATNEYPSLIRGGHNLITVRVATQPFGSMNRDVHILVSLHNPCVELHKAELSENAAVVFDPKDHEWKAQDFPKPVTLVPVPLAQIVGSLAGPPIMRNTVALGVTVALMGAPFEILFDVIHDQFKKKDQKIIDSNIQMAKAGYDYIKTTFPTVTANYLNGAQKKEDQLVINASEAVGVGAYRAGLKFAAIYPMTPINSLITFLADHAKELQIVYKQPEDEIAGINMAIGASLAGVRSMVATSGGGFALMVEGLALAGIMELPIVIDLGMRVGPATGMPTWTEQGELQFAIHAGHGEFPRIILAPADAAEAFRLTVDAFNLADRFQIPVFVMTDKYLNESQWCVPKSAFTGDVVIDRGKLAKDADIPTDGSFKRYALATDDGVSPRSVPGQKGGVYFSNSYEHDEVGHMTEDASMRVQMSNKRLKKFAAMKQIVYPPQIFGDTDAEITFVSWGSTRGAILDAIDLLAAGGRKARLVHLSWLFPFPAEAVLAALSSSTRIIDVEQNATGQLASLIREHTGLLVKEKILKYDGRPLYPEEIVEAVT